MTNLEIGIVERHIPFVESPSSFEEATASFRGDIPCLSIYTQGVGDKVSKVSLNVGVPQYEGSADTPPELRPCRFPYLKNCKW